MKVLKWIFDLGYKTAEAKYYNALMREINSGNRHEQRVFAIHDSETSSAYRNRLKEEEIIDGRLRELVDIVFKPEIFEVPEIPKTINRFDP